MDATVEEVYHLGRTLGQGAFSKVKLATHRATGEQVACKVMRLPRPMRCEECRACTARGLIMKEIDVLLDLDHPSVVSMREYFVHRNRVYLIMDLLRGGPWWRLPMACARWLRRLPRVRAPLLTVHGMHPGRWVRGFCWPSGAGGPSPAWPALAGTTCVWQAESCWTP